MATPYGMDAIRTVLGGHEGMGVLGQTARGESDTKIAKKQIDRALMMRSGD